MSTIIRFIIDMLPFMLIVIPIHVLLRLIILRKSKLNLLREAAMLIFVMFVVGLMSQAVIPEIRITDWEIHVINDGVHTTNLIPFKVLADTYNEVARGNVSALLINFLGNIVMFIPIGFSLRLLWDVSGAKAILAGLFTSIFIEISQLFLARSSDVDDIILNTTGAALGVLLFVMLNRIVPRFTRKFRK